MTDENEIIKTLTNDLPKETKKLTGVQKAAILLISLGVERATKILKQLPANKVEEITINIAKMQDIEPEMVETVRNEFSELMGKNQLILEGGTDYARDLLTESLGAKKAEEILGEHETEQEADAFTLFQSAEIEQAVHFLKKEQPQVTAVILAQLNAVKAAEILMALPGDIQAEVAYRMANMGKISSEVIEELEAIIKDEMSSDYRGMEDILKGTEAVANILNESSIATERKVLRGIDKINSELADEIKQQMFLFEDILDLDDRTLQIIITNLDKDALVMGLKGVSDELEKKFVNNMSERASNILLDEIEALGPVQINYVEDAQRKIIHTITKLEEAGKISIRKKSEQLIE